MPLKTDKKNIAPAIAIFLCGGSGSRMRGSVEDKILAPIAGTPALAYSLRAFEAAGFFSRLVCVFRDENQRAEIEKIIKNFSPALASIIDFCQGGNERRDSVFNALSFASASGKFSPQTRVFIHDCARPMIRPEALIALAKTASTEGSAVLAHRCKNTIKRVPLGASPETACKLEDLDRTRLWEMETPQVFPLGEIFPAYKNAVEKNLALTDDVAAASSAGVPVAIVENRVPNPKITVPEDLLFCQILAEKMSKK